MKGKQKIEVVTFDVLPVYDNEGKKYVMYVEKDGGWSLVEVYEDIVSSDDEEPASDVPMSPCTTSE